MCQNIYRYFFSATLSIIQCPIIEINHQYIIVIVRLRTVLLISLFKYNGTRQGILVDFTQDIDT